MSSEFELDFHSPHSHKRWKLSSNINDNTIDKTFKSSIRVGESRLTRDVGEVKIESISNKSSLILGHKFFDSSRHPTQPYAHLITLFRG